jgi:hypothetical protein
MILRAFLFIFSSQLLFASDYELKSEMITIPSNVQGLSDGQSRTKDFSYNVKHYLSKDGSLIPVVKKDQKTIKSFMSLLIYAYKNQDIKLFKSLFSPKSRSKININSPKVLSQLKAFSHFKRPYLKYILKYKDGYYVSYRDQILKNDRSLFLKKRKGKFFIEELNISEGEFLIHHYFIYTNFSPFKSNKISEASFNKNILKLKLSKAKNYLYIFDKTQNKILLKIQDNAYQNGLKDLDKKKKQIKVNLTKMKVKEDFYILETSYPMSYLLPKQKKLLTKVKLK